MLTAGLFGRIFPSVNRFSYLSALSSALIKHAWLLLVSILSDTGFHAVISRVNSVDMMHQEKTGVFHPSRVEGRLLRL